MRKFEFQNIPTVLQRINRWVVWREVKDEKGDIAKVPFNAYSGPQYNADPLDKKNWLNFDWACSAANHFGCGIGLVFDGSDDLVFIDLDNKGQNDEIAAMHRQAIERFNTYTEESPSGLGYHLIAYGKKPDDVQLPPGVEIYNRDRFATFTGWTINGSELRHAQWLLDLLPRKGTSGTINLGEAGAATSALDRLSADKALQAECAAVSTAPEGTRNNTLNNAAFALGTFVGAGTLSADVVATALLDAARQCGLSDTEAQKTIESGINSGMRRPRASLAPDPILPVGLPPAHAIAEAQQTPEQRAIASAPPPGRERRRIDPLAEMLRSVELGTVPHPSSPWEALPLPGIMGDIEAFLLQQSYTPNRLAAQFGALAWFAGVTGLVYGINGSGQNLYMIFTGRSASGKSATAASGLAILNNYISTGHPEEGTQLAFDDGNKLADSFVLPPDATTQVAILRALRGRTSAYSLMDEIHKQLAAMLSPRANSNEQSKRAAWLDLYDKAAVGQIIGGATYSKAENDQASMGPRALTLAGMTTKANFYKLVNEDNLKDGFINRFIIIEDDDEYKTDQFSPYKVPSLSLVQHCRQAMMFCAKQGKSSNGRIPVHYDEETELLARQFLSDIGRIRQHVDDMYSDLIGRASQGVARISSLLATANAPHAPIINRTMFQYAANMVMRSIWNICRRALTGDVGDDGGNERKQSQAFYKVIDDYFRADINDLTSYRVSEEMRKERIIPRRYLDKRLENVKAFYDDKRGARVCVDMLLRVACMNDEMEEIKKGMRAVYYKWLG